MKPCKAIYSNIDVDELGTGRIITSSLLKRYCENIQALHKDVQKLEDSTDPELRKTFHPPLIHEQHSYGIIFNKDKNAYEFNNSIQTTITDGIGQKKILITDLEQKENIYTKKLEDTNKIKQIENHKGDIYTLTTDLTELEKENKRYYIDKDTQTLHIHDKTPIIAVSVTVATNEPYIDTTNTTAYIDLEKHELRAPYNEKMYGEEVLDQNTAIDENGNIRPVEMYWNFGWRRTTPFYTIIETLRDPLNEDPTTPTIPTVARAFTINPNNSGLLTKIALLFKVKEGAEDDVYIEIRPIKDGLPSNEILAREKARIRGKTGQTLHTIPFSTPPLVKKDTKYAVVLRAGFTSSMKSYGIGGWSFATYSNEALAKMGNWIKKQGTGQKSGESTRIFGLDEKTFGDMFHSIDNTRTWTKAHSWVVEGFIEAWFDSMRPRVFSYQTYIKPLQDKPQYKEGTSFVYWKPIHTNTIQSVQLIPTSNVNNDNTIIGWEVSVNMKDWYEVKGPDWEHHFTVTKEKDRTKLYIRALIFSIPEYSPSIRGLKVIITTEPAKEAYIKTLFYNPRLSSLLGAHIWSEIGTSIQKDSKSKELTIEVDVIRNIAQVDNFEFKKEREFILSELPAKPVNTVIITTDNRSGNVLTENRDYTVDYKDKKIILNTENPDTKYLNEGGILRVEYHPLWLKGLKPEDFPVKTDVMKEEFETVEQKLQLRVVPLDPLRSIEKYDQKEESWTTLKEGEEYKVNYPSKEINLLKSKGEKEKYRVQYTPYLVDEGLALAYTMKRENLNEQITIKDYYFQNRV